MCSLKLVLSSPELTPSLGEALPQHTLIPRDSPQEVRKCVPDRIGNAWFSLPVEEKTAVGNFALALKAEEHGV
ncbi:MAG: hypothetical protein ACYCYK_13625, partial [Candidatus Dormibacteria bacterium]